MLLILVAGAFACDCEDNHERGIPKCIDRKILELELEPVRDPAASITMITTTTGKKYFYIPAQCCDFYSELYDDQCTLMCSPDGGISGQGQGNCPEYLVLEEEVIWKDKRGQ
jgi:hypothetical protein